MHLQVKTIDNQGHPWGALSCATVQINRQAGVNGIGKYCGQYGLSKGKNTFFVDEEIDLLKFIAHEILIVFHMKLT